MASGAVSYCLTQQASGEVSVAAWGDGADELIASIPTLLGSQDDPDSFDPRDERVRRAQERLRGLRMVRTGRVLESLVPAVLEQKIVGLDAFAMWQRLVTRFGEPAPGPAPAGMRLIPTNDV